MAAMSREALRAVCKEHRLYQTPALNDKLYCNFRGFGEVANLEEYVNLRALFLEGNAIDSLRGLPPLPQLKCLCVGAAGPLAPAAPGRSAGWRPC